MKLKTRLNYLKNLSSLKLHLKYKKGGGIELKTISETTITKIKGYSYDQGELFKSLFLILGFNVENISESKFNLFDYSIEKNNKFLQENNINYKVYYKTEINNTISFIELSKTN